MGRIWPRANAKGLLWAFLVSLLAVICTRIVIAAVESGNEGAAGAAPLLETPMRGVAVCYVYYCVVRVIGLFGQCMWTVSWEVYHDVPTMRRMLVRERRCGGACASQRCCLFYVWPLGGPHLRNAGEAAPEVWIGGRPKVARKRREVGSGCRQKIRSEMGARGSDVDESGIALGLYGRCIGTSALVLGGLQYSLSAVPM